MCRDVPRTSLLASKGYRITIVAAVLDLLTDSLLFDLLCWGRLALAGCLELVMTHFHRSYVGCKFSDWPLFPCPLLDLQLHKHNLQYQLQNHLRSPYIVWYSVWTVFRRDSSSSTSIDWSKQAAHFFLVHHIEGPISHLSVIPTNGIHIRYFVVQMRFAPKGILTRKGCWVPKFVVVSYCICLKAGRQKWILKTGSS